ncbi:ATP-binding cassette domain-containing protein [Demequina sp. SYSU T00192]|uniref:ATP-binding cassette domain-containing protein n=1 Tax=Demequina litoralis TaxID=3051660 RepID=A0ABT8G7L6_9MICO|nr:ATP-binding cassette domain-containing protein [Demequina sp. SYSU T00192]MDN4475142.1 ATP-binding cassette domain-containing protein [Demequina sp. SYSU T00192]
MIEVTSLSKTYGAKRAVNDISFTVDSGSVTGFLGPNGAGKSTTMRLILGLENPDTGTATVDGLPLAAHASPLRAVGALLDAKAVAPYRSARNHLRMLARTHRIPDSRVDEVIALTGLESVARKSAREFSLGMGQRLGIATALLGDPETLILDEPVNGLDPDGVIWVRELVKGFASEGRTVFLSSHLMSEMALTADRVIVIGRGQILADTTIDALVAGASGASVRVRSPQAAHLATILDAHDGSVAISGSDLLHIRGLDAAQVGEHAAAHGIVLHELATTGSNLESAYMELTAEAVEYRSDARPAGGAA